MSDFLVSWKQDPTVKCEQHFCISFLLEVTVLLTLACSSVFLCACLILNIKVTAATLISFFFLNEWKARDVRPPEWGMFGLSRLLRKFYNPLGIKISRIFRLYLGKLLTLIGILCFQLLKIGHPSHHVHGPLVVTGSSATAIDPSRLLIFRCARLF